MQSVVLILLSFSAISRASNATKECLFECEGWNEPVLCVSSDLRCDDFPNCLEGEDEKGCVCDFSCDSTTQCYEMAQRCNGEKDCQDGSDEILCDKAQYRRTHPNLAEKDLCKKPCAPNGSCSFMSNDVAICHCAPGYTGEFCLERDAFHDDAADEKSREFECLDGIKKGQESFCDGHFDCQDKSDEANCTLADYKRSKPDLSGDLLCLMPCQAPGIRCRLDANGRAFCPCPPDSEGKFCERRLQPSTPSSTTTKATTLAGPLNVHSSAAREPVTAIQVETSEKSSESSTKYIDSRTASTANGVPAGESTSIVLMALAGLLACGLLF